MRYGRVQYDDLNAKQKERYNFQKVSALLADYGFITISLSDDWNGADFLAIHKDGDVLKVQLKGRMTFDKKYSGKELYLCFRDGAEWYLYPHDVLFEQINADLNLTETESWRTEGKYSFPRLSDRQKSLLKQYSFSSTGFGSPGLSPTEIDKLPLPSDLKTKLKKAV